jgi:uncharacterized membrane protein
MEEAIRSAVHHVVPVVEAIGALIIAAGVVVAFALWALGELRSRSVTYEDVRLLLGRYLALGLEFQLGADILGTAVSPSWNEIGKLGAIAGIRTLLNYFLAKELERAGKSGSPTINSGIAAATRAIAGRSQ